MNPPSLARALILFALAASVAFGEDYELLFSAAPGAAGAICSAATMNGVNVTRIGELTAAQEVVLAGALAWPLAQFQHFGGSPR